MSNDALMWIGFNVFVLLMLALDLGVFHKKNHIVGIKEALTWSAVWIALALAFNYGIYHFMGAQKGLEFFTGYIIEKSLSVDNIFVFVMIFTYFNVNPLYQHKVLFWGIIGALIMRAIFIFAGVALIAKFHWVIYIFGGFLIITGIKMLLQDDKKIDPDKNPVIRLFKRYFSVTPDFVDDKFFVKQGLKWFATPLFVVVVFVEVTDLIFAVDSIPAILAVTNDPFIVYTSNVFAILGLRALYFALAGITKYFTYLKYGLAIILVFVGIKMCIVDFYKIPIFVSLSVIAGILALSVLASVVFPKKSEEIHG